MIIANEFSVGAEIDAVWRELLDMEGVASCLPGATIEATEQENVYDGSMRLKIGPMRVEYRGTATLSEVDEGSHTAVISLSAREAKGQGGATATIRNRLESTDSGTRVSAETDLSITGPQAQFGRGVIEDVGKRVLGEFSRRLEQRITGGGEAGGATAQQTPQDETGAASSLGAPAGGPAAPVPPPIPPPRDELDVGALLSHSPAVRAGAAGVLVALLVVLFLLRRSRR